MCRFSLPPGYTRTRPVAKPKLGPLIPVIDAILETDRTAPAKQRHTAKRIFERLRDEHGFAGGYPRETTEAFLDGHVSAFAFFGGVPLSILYDNTTIAVAKICGDGKRERTRAFTELCSHYLFCDRFGRPAKGNDKGKVEGLVADTAALRPLPAVPLEPCEERMARVSSTALVRYRTNDYSVPTAYGFRDVVVKGFVDTVVILCGAEEIARHPRCYAQGAFIADPLHYLALIETKPMALDQAAALQGWALPEVFQHLRHLLEARLGNKGRREFIQVLRLLETMPLGIVADAVGEAIRLGAIAFDAVKLIALARIEQRPARLDLTAYPHLPRMDVKTTRAADYAVLAA